MKDNMALAAREITVVGKIDYETAVRGAVKNIGFDPFFDVLSSVDSKGIALPRLRGTGPHQQAESGLCRRRPRRQG